MDTVRESIKTSKDKRRKNTKNKIYETARNAAKSKGVEWIEPVERPAQYHKIL